MLNIVIPMAGAGSRFQRAGYSEPKPLISLNGVPMIRLVIDNLRPTVEHRFIFVCLSEHISRYKLRERLLEWAPNSITLGIEGVTDGAACTVLKARAYIDNEASLMIANSDQYVNVDIDEYLKSFQLETLDGLIMTMKADDPKWSYVGLTKGQLVTKVVEKQVISDMATVGIYNFSKGSDFVRGADAMIAKNKRSANEFYVAPVYNELLALGSRVGIFDVGKEGEGMFGLGTPQDLRLFLSSTVATKLARTLKG